jgi:CDP-2,3-bis-(O-geranylgeranyl)-sn-glycerol synthase
MIELVVEALYFFLPAYVANTCACLFGRGRPLDGGRSLPDGHRILGDGVTVRGSLVGVLSGTLIAFFQAGLAPNRLLVGFLLSLGAIVGDAGGSFLKRRLGLSRGAPAPLLDQLNFVVGGLLFASFVLPFGEAPLTGTTVLILFLLTPVGHLLVNKAGYLFHLKDVPW